MTSIELDALMSALNKFENEHTESLSKESNRVKAVRWQVEMVYDAVLKNEETTVTHEQRESAMLRMYNNT